MQGLIDGELESFSNRIAATAIVNNAILRCQLLGLPVNEDNVILCIGDFFDPANLHYSGIVVEIDRIIDMTLGIIQNKNWDH